MLHVNTTTYQHAAYPHAQGAERRRCTPSGMLHPKCSIRNAPSGVQGATCSARRAPQRVLDMKAQGSLQSPWQQRTLSSAPYGAAGALKKHPHCTAQQDLPRSVHPGNHTKPANPPTGSAPRHAYARAPAAGACALVRLHGPHACAHVRLHDTQARARVRLHDTHARHTLQRLQAVPAHFVHCSRKCTHMALDAPQRARLCSTMCAWQRVCGSAMRERARRLSRGSATRACRSC
jgi:hypothetical protein